MGFEVTMLIVVVLGLLFTWFYLADIVSKMDDITTILRQIRDELRKEADDG